MVKSVKDTEEVMIACVLFCLVNIIFIQHHIKFT